MLPSLWTQHSGFTLILGSKDMIVESMDGFALLSGGLELGSFEAEST